MELSLVQNYEYFLSALSPSTSKTYDFVLQKFKLHLEGSGGSLERFSRSDVQTYLNALLKRNMTPASVAKIYHAIRKWAKHANLQQAVEEIRIPRPARLADMPVKSLNRNERNHLVREVERGGNIRDIAIVHLLLETGIRVMELVNLDLERVVIGERSGSIRVIGKQYKERIIPLPPDARYWLRKYMGERKEGPVFLSTRKSRVSVNTVQKMLSHYGVHPHMLRHTYCRTLVASGVDLATVASLAGHADVNVTRRYAKPSEEGMGDLVEKAFSE